MVGAKVLKNKLFWGVVLVVSVVGAALLVGSSKKDPMPATVPAIAVDVMPAASGTIHETVTAVGIVSAFRDAEISSETSGRVTKVAVNVGDPVREGEPLIFVDDELKAAALDQAKAQLLAAETNLAKARRDYDRAETLFKSGDVADVELEGNRLAMHAADAQYKGAQAGLRAAQRQYDDTRIKAPFSGQVASRSVEVGEMVGPGSHIANIIDVSSWKVKLGIPEEEIGSLRVHQCATVRLDSYRGDPIVGKVLTVGAKSETPTGHTYPVEVIVNEEKAGVLKAGMFVRVEIYTGTAIDALVLSKESLVGDERDPRVFVVENGVAHLRSIRLGLRNADSVQVAAGLAKGELIVTFGQKGLKDGSAVRYQHQ